MVRCGKKEEYLKDNELLFIISKSCSCLLLAAAEWKIQFLPLFAFSKSPSPLVLSSFELSGSVLCLYYLQGKIYYLLLLHFLYNVVPEIFLIPLPIEFGVSDYTKTFASFYIYI